MFGYYPEPVPCSTGGDYGTPFKSTDKGKSGQVTFESYKPLANCYVDIGSSCDANGLQVEITHMELEAYDFEYCLGAIHFEMLKKDGKTVEKTDPQCGCLAKNHPSCVDYPFDHPMVTKRPTQYKFINTNVKIVLRADMWTDGGGKVEVKWKCITPLTTTTSTTPTTTSTTTVSTYVTNTLEMAKALLIGNFTPEMVRDYGCAGRELFDPFARTIGSHVDSIDAAFFTWKKCVQCASSNDKSNVLAYSYDIKSDTCGKLI